jgi:tetratricopeptide (TPR) repeat protein
MIPGKIIKAVGILLLLACILQPVLAAGTQLKDNATEYYDNGEIAISNGQFDQAVQYFDLALADNTTLLGMSDGLMYLYKDKAAALAELGQYDEALKTVNTGLGVVKNTTKTAGLWNNEGYIYTKQGDYNDAVGAYNHAVTADPSYLKGWLNLGDSLVKTGRYSDAINAYNKALTLDPGNTGATAGLAEAQKGASSPLSSPVIIALVIILIIAAGGAVWYIKFRKPDERKPGDKKAEGKKK